MSQEAHTTHEAQMTHELYVKCIFRLYSGCIQVDKKAHRAHVAHEAPMAHK